MAMASCFLVQHLSLPYPKSEPANIEPVATYRQEKEQQVAVWPRLEMVAWAEGELHGAQTSFFGDGFVEMPLVKSYTAVQLHVQFYTSQRSGLLFLAAGQTDYLLLELRAGVLQARLDLGSEELTVKSPAGPHLNNLVIHDADLLVANGQMSLTVDGLFNASVVLPDPPHELDIDYGLYVGGTGSLELPYLTGASLPFRGCLHAVTFNDHDVLSALASSSATKRIHGVREGCSEEFSAGPDDSLGFLGPNSYITFPGWSARAEGTIEFVITTSIKQAPLIYQSGLQNDFFYLEIFDGRLRGVVEKGNGPVVLHNNIYLSNEQEHYVKVHMDVRRFEILVDYYASKTSNKGIHNYLDLQGPLFIGGLNEKAATRLREQRLAFSSGNGFSNSSFIGCMEDLRINLEKRSLRDALVTRDITAGCGQLEQFTEYDDVYEQDEASTSPSPDYWQGPVMEPCRPDPNLPPVFANFTKLLHVSPLVVAEGGTAFLEWRHTQPTIELSSANIRQSQVLFKVTTDPRHGQLELDIFSGRSRRKFTLLDIVNRKVKYVHDGSEGPMDQVLLEVTITSRRGIPECLWQGQTYLLPVKINPVNDAPEVVFPHGDLMVILEHTRKHLNSDIIQALDDDTPCDSLRFQLLGGKRMEEGYVEYDFHPGVPIEEFSCRDLEAGHVVYVHQSGPTSPLIFQVNDGIVMSPVATLRVVAMEPDIQVRNNTGLFVSQGGVVPIITANLSVETNAVQQKVPILYRLTTPLQYGEIQKQGGLGGEWKKVESFHQQDVEQGHVQYFSTDAEHLTEDVIEKVQFEVQVGQKTLRNNTFLIRIKRATIRMKTMVPLRMKNERQRNITAAELEAALEESSSGPAFFHYLIIQPPKKGNLELHGSRLTNGFGFTQEDLENNHLSYSATIRDSKESEDFFKFRVTAEAHYSPVYTYTIHIGGDPDAPTLTNVLLSVLEGGQAVISKDHLFVKTVNSMDYTYEVIDGPTHGKLIWRTSGNWPSGEEAITKFTNEDILQGRLAYQHDDSETLEDDIPFVALRQDEGSSDLDAEDVRGVFRVSIQPVNDHTPVQVVNKVFNVVRHGQRLLTTDDIAFVDEDSGFSDAHLVLVRKDILFGSIIAVDNRSLQVYRFTQDDLRKKKILFVHSGADRGWIQFQVSDGLHQATTLLEVQASDPYLKIKNHTGLVIRQGGQGTIDSSILSLETNMDIRNDEEILFRIIAPPQGGVVLRGGQEVSSFTQRDLLSGEVLYHHNGSRSSQDLIYFSVEVNQVVVEGTLKVTVSLDSHSSPLNFVHHERIHILQGEAVEIKNDYLLVQHEDVPPQDIIYTVTIPPLSGFLVALSQGPTSEEPPDLDPIQAFTQEDINEGKVLYLHSNPEIQSDQFTVDIAANGVDTLEGVVVSLEILPISIPLEVHNITVIEGSSKAISMDVLNIPSTYFSALNVEFVVLKSPEHGILQNAERPEEGNLRVFSWFEVEQQLISYVHDGSESFADAFTVVANVSEVNQQSQARTVSVEVIPSNDEAPVVLVNRELQMPEGGTAEISPELLLSEDEDTSPDEVVYSIRTPVNGKVVLKSSPQNWALRFTQAQINSQLVQFVHEGTLEGGFSFDVSDGENMSPGHYFTVLAHKKPTITLENKQDLTICPGSSQPITSQNLKAVANNEAETQSIVYIVEQAPKFGKLVHSQKGSDGGNLKNFTQAEVDNGEILYQHEMPDQPFWLLQDALHFRISSPSIITDPYILGLSVSFEVSCPQRTTPLWKNKGLTVPEAQSAVIDTSVLDASNLLAKEPESKRAAYDVIFLVTELPHHGSLSLPDGPVNRKHPYFLQSDLVKGGLEYAHHGSGTLDDHFRFNAWLRRVAVESLQPPQKGEELIVSETFNITVSDSNEMPPRVISQGAVLQVLHNSPVMLSQEHLNVIDPDSSPDEIRYDVLPGPSSGYVASIHNQQVPVTQFTQADINAGLLMFIANETSAPGPLDLSISDGHNPSIFTSLEVMILPATTWATNQTPLEIDQDVNMALLSADHLLGTSGQGEPNTQYRLIRDPQFGQVRVDQNPASVFSQKQVDNREVTFTFTDFTSPKDEFQFIATSGGVNISGTVNVTVRALVKTQEDILWPRGTTVLLDTKILDASELANKTTSVPVFKIFRAPQGSHFVKVSNDKGEHPISIDAFNQHDLERGMVALEIWDAEDPGLGLQQDSFQFELVAEGVPPALESVAYTTEAFNSSAAYVATLLHVPDVQDSNRSPTAQSITPSSQMLTSQPQGSENPGHGSSKQPVLPTSWVGQGVTTSTSPAERGPLLSFIEANMFSIILPVCLILLLLALILPLLFYVHKRNKTGKHNVQGTPPKYKNGTVVDQETFRKTDPNQTIPLMTVNTLEAKGPVSKGAGGQQDPELLQYCRTSNPALKNSQYWV
ncbi:chondroitin sulfate proteoglycan 4 [Eublepharis macularius]|uniref:Chondroitin sulfate proteoglycan 4 n=1 Tax=Eublepharis macularius TaxID=481883 RepID=A0AA97KMH5_EUBMA|nr:chondroitin sulfate proteoglycan 4 [Eublepharis macularius]